MDDFLLGIFLVFIEHLSSQSSAWVMFGWGDLMGRSSQTSKAGIFREPDGFGVCWENA